MKFEEVAKKFEYLTRDDVRAYTQDEADLALRIGIMQSVNPEEFKNAFDKIKEAFMPKVVVSRFEALKIDFDKSDIVFFSTIYRTVGSLLHVFYTGLFLSIIDGHAKVEDNRIVVPNLRGTVFGGGIPIQKAIDVAWDNMKYISSAENFIDSQEVHDAIAEYLNTKNNAHV
jgi:hypothetical protein